MIKTRFAPSPTGDPHIGNIRTALFAWLFAKKHGGKFILRIEDTDQNRVIQGSFERILESLQWLGLDWDEGPYFQSKRLDIYKEQGQKLIEEGSAYYCFCSEERLRQIKEEQIKKGVPAMYDKKCRALRQEEIKQRLKQKELYVVRLKIPEQGSTKFQDLIHGEIEFQNNLIDDQVLIKSDGFPTYHLASTIDDYLMGITHVIRGDEWLSSTSKHVIIYNALKVLSPKFAHLPVILGQDKSKLSKRHGAVSILEYKEQGYLPEALINFLALLGWNPKDNRELFTREELIQEFDLSKIQKSAAVFDINKLDWMNGVYIRNLDIDELAKRCNLDGRVVLLVRERIKKLGEIGELTRFLREDIEYDPKILIPKNGEKNKTKELLTFALERIKNIDNQDWNIEKLKDMLEKFVKDKGISRGEILWPIRVAITGLEASPGVFEVLEVLGKEKSVSRIEKVIETL